MRLTGFITQLFAFSLILVSGCSLQQINHESKQIIDRGRIKGDVNVTNGAGVPVEVILFRKEGASMVAQETHSLQGAGVYIFNVPPGTYYVAAYQDVNSDDSYQRSEPAAVYGGTSAEDAEPIKINAGNNIKLEALTITRPLVSETRPDNVSFDLKDNHAGEVVSLYSPIFDPKTGNLGLWKPLTFVEQYGVGLYLLQPYRAGITPVIFIHGAGGSPRSFEELIGTLDSDYYQPWVLHYPSGFSLDIVSDYLVGSINKLHAQYQFKRLVLIAHSMGGLVLRAAVMKYLKSDHKADFAAVMTINSPMMGMASAASGVLMSPVVVSSWYDVAEGSQFIDEIMNWTWPDDIPYYLVFSYQSGKGGDGVVKLESQIPVSLQQEATRIYGFNSGHADILTEPAFISSFHEIMKSASH